MNKKRNDDLIQKAEKALQSGYVDMLNAGTIKDSFNGQTAAFGVTVALSGLRPAFAIYLKKTEECDRPQILNAIAVMMGIKQKEAGDKLFQEILKCDANKLNDYKRDILDCSIALKQVIRTYKLV